MKSNSKTFEICQIAFGAVIITICAWIMIPTAVPFTLQTFGVFTILQLLGGRKGLITICLYLLMGLLGLPVFSGFTGGPAVFLNVTGGYLVGFVLMALCFLIGEKVFAKRKRFDVIMLVAGLIVCYAFGSVWLAYIYGGIDMFYKACSVGVLPFIVPDAIKLVLSVTVSKMVRKHLRF